MIRRPPRSTRTDTLFPSTTLFRSLDDGEVICESAAICRYFEALQPDPPLFGRSPVEIARIESWTRRIENDGYTAVVYAFRNSRSEEHTSELQSLMRISSAVFCLKKNNKEGRN